MGKPGFGAQRRRTGVSHAAKASENKGGEHIGKKKYPVIGYIFSAWPANLLPII